MGIIQKTFLLVAFSSVFLGFLFALPIHILPADIINSIIVIFTYAKAWNFIIPFDHMFLASSLVFSFHFAMLGWWITKWLVGISARLTA